MQIAFRDPPLAEGGVVLRRMEAEDIGWITVACGDRELSPYSEADARALAEHAARRWAEGKSVSWASAG